MVPAPQAALLVAEIVAESRQSRQIVAESRQRRRIVAGAVENQKDLRLGTFRCWG